MVGYEAAAATVNTPCHRRSPPRHHHPLYRLLILSTRMHLPSPCLPMCTPAGNETQHSRDGGGNETRVTGPGGGTSESVCSELLGGGGGPRWPLIPLQQLCSGLHNTPAALSAKLPLLPQVAQQLALESPSITCAVEAWQGGDCRLVRHLTTVIELEPKGTTESSMHVFWDMLIRCDTDASSK